MARKSPRQLAMEEEAALAEAGREPRSLTRSGALAAQRRLRELSAAHTMTRLLKRGITADVLFNRETQAVLVESVYLDQMLDPEMSARDRRAAARELALFKGIGVETGAKRALDEVAEFRRILAARVVNGTARRKDEE